MAQIDEHAKAKVAEIAKQYPQIPAGLLSAVGDVESGGYQADIVSGKQLSPAGAIGVMQFMPATAKDEDVDPLDVESAAHGAAKYLINLHKETGSWRGALTSYNWGIGNYKKFLSGERKDMPKEAAEYASKVFASQGNPVANVRPHVTQHSVVDAGQPPQEYTPPQVDVPVAQPVTVATQTPAGIMHVAAQTKQEESILRSIKPDDGASLGGSLPFLADAVKSIRGSKPLIPTLDPIDKMINEILDIV